MSVNINNFFTQANELYQRLIEIQNTFAQVEPANLPELMTTIGSISNELTQLVCTVEQAFEKNETSIPEQTLYPVLSAEDITAERSQISSLLFNSHVLATNLSIATNHLLFKKIVQIDSGHTMRVENTIQTPQIDNDKLVFEPKSSQYILRPTTRVSLEINHINKAIEFLGALQTNFESLSEEEFYLKTLSGIKELNNSVMKELNDFRENNGFVAIINLFETEIEGHLKRILDEESPEKLALIRQQFEWQSLLKITCIEKPNLLSLLLSDTSKTQIIRATKCAIVQLISYTMKCCPSIDYTDLDKQSINQAISFGLKALEQIELSKEDLQNPEAPTKLAHILFAELYNTYKEFQETHPEMISPHDPSFHYDFGRHGWTDDRIPLFIKQQVLAKNFFF